MDNYILEKMEDIREQALTKLSNIVHKDYVEEFADCFCYAFRDGVCSAERLANWLDLGLLDIYALHCDEENFYKLFCQCEVQEIGEMQHDMRQRD